MVVFITEVGFQGNAVIYSPEGLRDFTQELALIRSLSGQPVEEVVWFAKPINGSVVWRAFIYNDTTKAVLPYAATKAQYAAFEEALASRNLLKPSKRVTQRVNELKLINMKNGIQLAMPL